MKYTNKFNLPQTIVNLAERDTYSKGAADVSVTEVIGPPRIKYLWRKHFDDIEIDVSGEIWRMFGQTIHMIAEQGADEVHLSEERLFSEVNGWIISGAIDVQMIGEKSCNIIDYKSTSVWAIQEPKPDWEAQLNMYAWLIEKEKGWKVKDIHICAFLRDWKKFEAERDKEKYPQAPAWMVKVKRWTRDKVRKYIEERVYLHQDNRRAFDWGEEPIECTDEERWLRDHKWAVKKSEGKRATKVFDTEKEALKFCAEISEKKKTEYVIEERKGEPIRCVGDYCNVSKWCSQYEKWKVENGVIE